MNPIVSAQSVDSPAVSRDGSLMHLEALQLLFQGLTDADLALA
jgi:hypothetical protein